MKLRHVMLAVFVAAMAVAPVARAQEAPTCADEHLTGADCQGADLDSSPNGCRIKVWVGKATCDLVVPDGAASRAVFGTWAYADQGTIPEVDIVIRDKATGTVLHNTHWMGEPPVMDPSQIGTAAGRFVDDVAQGRIGYLFQDLVYGIPGSVEGQLVRNTNGSAGTPLSGGGAEVTCEITGTHSVLGAATAAAGETPDVDLFGQASPGLPQRYNNSFDCIVDPTEPGPPAISPGLHGCVAMNPPVPFGPTGYGVWGSCGFIGDASGIPSGIISTTTGSYTVSHESPSGTVIDIAGSGPNAYPFMFAEGVHYMLTVNGDGVGAVVAGSPE